MRRHVCEPVNPFQGRLNAGPEVKTRVQNMQVGSPVFTERIEIDSVLGSEKSSVEKKSPIVFDAPPQVASASTKVQFHALTCRLP